MKKNPLAGPVELLFDTGQNLFEDLKVQYKDNFPTQNSTILLYATRALFQNFIFNFGGSPSSLRKNRKNVFTGYIEHVTNVKTFLSVDFWTNFLQNFFPPQTNGSAKKEEQSRFRPYNTETIFFPLVIYATIFFLLLFFVTLFLLRRIKNQKHNPFYLHQNAVSGSGLN